MDTDTVQHMKPRPYQPFLPLFFSLAGWALLQAWIQLIGANFRAHILVAVPGLVLTLWSALPFPATRQITVQKEDRPRREPRWAVIASALLLLAVGVVLGNLIAKGSLFLLGVVAMTLNFIPWARLPLGQRHPGVPCAAAGCGFGVAMLAGHQSMSVMFLPLATWAFWLCTCVGLILRAEQSRRRRHGVPAMRAATDLDSRSTAYET